MSWIRRIQLVAAMGIALASVASAQPRLLLSTTSIGPVFVAAGANGTAQTVQAFNAGTGTLNLSLAVSASWLAATPGTAGPCTFQSSGTCIPIQISLNTSALADGTYTEYATVTSPGAVDSPQQVSVTVTVANVPTSVTLYATPNGGTATASIYPHSTIVGVTSTQTGGNWLSLQNPSGLPPYTFGQPYSVQAVTQTGQATGVYSGSIGIGGSTYGPDNITVNVTLNVTTNPIIQVNNTELHVTGYQGGPQITTAVGFTNTGQGTLNVASATGTSASNFLSATVTSSSSISITADPLQLAPGFYSGTVTISSNAANNAQVSIPVELDILPAGQPFITQAGVVNIATFANEPIAQGDILAVFGDQFASAGSTYTNSGTPLASQLGTTQVLVNGVAAPLYYVSRQQINFQVPYSTAVAQIATIQVVSNGTTSNIRSVEATGVVPRILLWPTSFVQGNYGIAVNADGSLALPTGDSFGVFNAHPTRAGATVVFYCIGLGQTSPGATDGTAASSQPVESTSAVSVTFGSSLTGSVTTQSTFAGLVPTLVALYQVNVQVPNGVPIGSSIPVYFNLNGNSGNSVNIAISQ